MDFFQLDAQAFLNDLWLETSGRVPMRLDLGQKGYDLNTLRKEALSIDFVQKMINRKVMGALRYERKGREINYDRLGRILDLVKKYKKEGNDEYLVDIANFAELEYRKGTHKNKHFKSNDDTGGHCVTHS